MAKSRGKKTRKSKASVKVRDLEPRKNPKGGKVKHSDINIVKKIDKSSPILF